MIHRRSLALAAGALLACGVARAAQPDIPPQSDSDRPVYLQDNDSDTDNAATQKPALQDLLDRAGIGQTLWAWGLRINGYVEGGYTYDWTAENAPTNYGRAFDITNNRPRLDQAGITLEREIDRNADKFDVGGKVFAMYGADAGVIHSNGLRGYDNGPFQPINQFDVTEAYLTTVIPFGNHPGLELEAGKFADLLGYEKINPTENALYSHSFEFALLTPYTQSGVLAQYDILKDITLWGGVTRGWNQSTRDDNGSVDGIGGVEWNLDRGITAKFNVSIGPQQAANESDYLYFLEGIVAYAPPDADTTMTVDAFVSWEDDGGGPGVAAFYYGINSTITYKLADQLNLNLRGEWFHDQSGALPASPGQVPEGGFIGLGGNNDIYEVTVGLDIRPFANMEWLNGLQIRPEIRWDDSSLNPVFAGEHPGPAGDDREQLTVALDVIYAF